MEVLQDTYKDTKIGRIPKDWEIKQLASICDIVMGQSPSSESYNENDTGLPLVQGNADIKSRITKPRIYTSQITKISEVDDIIMTVRAPVGAIAKSNIKSCIGRGVCALRVKSIDNEFLYQMLIEKETSWIRLEQGSTFSAVNSKDIKTFKIALPPLPEQQKIAAILTTVDEQISATDKIIEKSKELKKGLIQKLFSEGIGHTEFKDTKIGRFPKDWKLVLLGEVFKKIVVGFVGSVSEYYCPKDEGVLFLRTKNIKENKLSLKGVEYVTKEFASKNSKSNIENGDIIIARVGITGTACMIRGLENSANCANVIILKKEENVNSLFFDYLINSWLIQKQIQSNTAGGVQLVFNTSLSKKLKIPLPSKNEQQKIAAILSEADAKIEKEQTQKAQLEALKKGLMQQLLTGKKRVKV
jgi:type I restriction enzyme S subunit